MWWRLSTVSSDRADEGGVNRDLQAAPNGQGVGHNLQAAVVQRLDPRRQGRDFGDYTRGWQRAAGIVLETADGWTTC